MFRAGLARKQDEFLGAAAFGVEVHHEFKPRRFQFVQREIGNFDIAGFGARQHNPRALQKFMRAFLRRALLFFGEHGYFAINAGYFSAMYGFNLCRVSLTVVIA